MITAGSFNALPFEAIVHTVPPFWPRSEDHPTDDDGASLAAAREEWAVQLGRQALLIVALLYMGLLTMALLPTAAATVPRSERPLTSVSSGQMVLMGLMGLVGPPEPPGPPDLAW